MKPELSGSLERPLLEVQILDDRIHQWGLPQYQTTGSAGMDLRACLAETLILAPNDTCLVCSGIAIHIGDPFLMAMIVPRSGLGSRGLVLGNLTGIVDADYQGEIRIPLWNRSSEPITVQPGDRVAQLILAPIVRAQLRIVSEFVASGRGAGGFGSTGHA
ncbi:dUTP diphosphatase [Thiomonas sp.]